MTQVNTVRGPVDAAGLGATLMHEHVFVLSPEIEKTSEEWDEDAAQSTAVQRLQEVKDSGIDTIVDLTVIGLGRFIPRIVSVAERVPDLNIVVATGVYTYNDVPMFFHFRGPGTILGGPEPMTELFVREIEEGIGETGVRAGILKCATDMAGITPGVERVSAGGGPGPPPDRHPDHHPHPRPRPSPGASSSSGSSAEEGVDLEPGGHRALGRHPGHRVPRGVAGQRLLPGVRPLRHRHLLGGRTGRVGQGAVRPGARRPDRALP